MVRRVRSAAPPACCALSGSRASGGAPAARAGPRSPSPAAPGGPRPGRAEHGMRAGRARGARRRHGCWSVWVSGARVGRGARARARGPSASPRRPRGHGSASARADPLR